MARQCGYIPRCASQGGVYGKIASLHASTPIKTPFTISIIAADEILLVTLRFRPGADRDAIEACMFRIADTLAAIEEHSEKEMQGILWEQKRMSRTEHCITLRRNFSDPEYPRKFNAAFQRLNSDFDIMRIH